MGPYPTLYFKMKQKRDGLSTDTWALGFQRKGQQGEREREREKER